MNAAFVMQKTRGSTEIRLVKSGAILFRCSFGDNGARRCEMVYEDGSFDALEYNINKLVAETSQETEEPPSI